jgi:hypothetical protein
MKRLMLGFTAALLLAGASAVSPAAALPAAPGAIGTPLAGASNVDQVRWVCWWRYGRRVCAWRPGPRYYWRHRYHRRHWW